MFPEQKKKKMIEKVNTYLKEMRSDEGFQSMLVDAREVPESVEAEPVFWQEVIVRQRKVKRQFDYESKDEGVLDPKQSFKTKFYFYILDQTITSIDERFSQLKEHFDTFGFLYDFECLKGEPLLKKCGDLQNALSDGSHKDVEGYQLYQELTLLQTILPSTAKTPLEVLKYLMKNELTQNFPNVSVAMRIVLTLPVTVATAERSFSKLKLIKNYLRSTMSQERLLGLSFTSIEYEVLEKLDLDQTIQDFCEKKARKVCFSK